MSWNYRVGTYVCKYDEELAKTLNRPGDRLFKIIECYYSKDGTPDGYAQRDVTSSHEDVSSLKWVCRQLIEAFAKPVLDLDNWPSEYKEQ